MHDTGCLGLVHWDDPEGWDGEERGGRAEQPLGRGSALPRLGAELELRRSGSSLGPSQ